MISVHSHDFCTLCQLIGPIATVRFHIVDRHVDQLCHVCCSRSPVFVSGNGLRQHLSERHSLHPFPRGLSPSTSSAPSRVFACFDCSTDEVVFTNANSYQRHLLKEHLTKGDVLKPMRKKRRRQQKAADAERSMSSQVKRVHPIRNDTGQDCFAICVLHLIAQTDLDLYLPPIQHHNKVTQFDNMVPYYERA